MNESKERKVGIILSYFSLIATTIIQLIYTPFLIKMMGQSEYGLYSLVYSVIGYLTVLDLGFGNAIIVYTTKFRAQKKYEEEKKLYGMFKIVFTVIGIIAFLIGIIVFFNINNIFGNNMTSEELEKMRIMMLILSFNLFITFVFSIYSSIITAYEKFSYQKIMAILNTILKPLIMIPLLFLGYKSIAMSIVVTLVNLFVLISNYLYCKKKLNITIKYYGFDNILFKQILGYSFWIFLTTIVDKVNWSVDQTILGIVSGTIAVSIYSVATNFNTMFINLSTAISGVMLPKVTKMVANEATNQELTNEFIKVGRIQFYVMFLITTGFILVGKEFIIWWVGTNFVESYYVTLFLIIPAFFSLIQNLGLSIMQANNKFKFKSLSTFIMSIFNIVISIALAKRYGAVGAAAGTTISLVICNIILINIYYYKVIKLNILKFWKDIAIMILKMFIPLFITVFLMKIFKGTGLISVIIYGLIYTLLYAVTAYTIVMNKYEKNLVKSIFIKIRKIWGDKFEKNIY